ncbi:MAG: hypothetical protein NTX26_00240 [Candidatus Parcubacteria bacterium]|nr:hypothetical protein [Candidatus Parcubacteria bacterium]
MITEKIVDGNTTIQYSINPLNRCHKPLGLVLKTLIKIAIFILVVVIYLALILLLSSKFKLFNLR